MPCAFVSNIRNVHFRGLIWFHVVVLQLKESHTQALNRETLRTYTGRTPSSQLRTSYVSVVLNPRTAPVGWQRAHCDATALHTTKRHRIFSSFLCTMARGNATFYTDPDWNSDTAPVGRISLPLEPIRIPDDRYLHHALSFDARRCPHQVC